MARQEKQNFVLFLVTSVWVTPVTLLHIVPPPNSKFGSWWKLACRFPGLSVLPPSSLGCSLVQHPASSCTQVLSFWAHRGIGVWGVLEGLGIFSLDKKTIHGEMILKSYPTRGWIVTRTQRRNQGSQYYSANNWLPRETAVQEGS